MRDLSHGNCIVNIILCAVSLSKELICIYLKILAIIGEKSMRILLNYRRCGVVIIVLLEFLFVFFTAHHLGRRRQQQRIGINALRVRNNKWLRDGWRETFAKKKSYNHFTISSPLFLATLSSSTLLQHACVKVWEVHSQNWSFFMVLSTEKKSFSFYQKSISTLLIFIFDFH